MSPHPCRLTKIKLTRVQMQGPNETSWQMPGMHPQMQYGGPQAIYGHQDTQQGPHFAMHGNCQDATALYHGAFAGLPPHQVGLPGPQMGMPTLHGPGPMPGFVPLESMGAAYGQMQGMQGQEGAQRAPAPAPAPAPAAAPVARAALRRRRHALVLQWGCAAHPIRIPPWQRRCTLSREQLVNSTAVSKGGMTKPAKAPRTWSTNFIQAVTKRSKRAVSSHS